MEAQPGGAGLNFSEPSFAQMYERWLVAPLFRPWAELALDTLVPGPGERLLDVACGTGIVARLAKERGVPGGRIIGVDASADMLAVARAAAPDVGWCRADAAALPGASGGFDVAVCQQGLQFFPDKAAAVREIRRVLAPGGRLAISVWRPLEDAPLLQELHRIGERHLGPIVDRRHAFGERGALEALLREAGLRDVRVEAVSRRISFRDGSTFLHMNTRALIGMSRAGKALAAAQRRDIETVIASESQAAAARHTDSGGLGFDIAANFALAIR
jgi:ubiquinone/menaquinone biosynthesis C-methylase UbiE